MSSVRLCLLEMSRKLQQHGCLNKDLNKRDREIGGYMETVGEMKGKCDIIIFNSSKRKKEIQKGQQNSWVEEMYHSGWETEVTKVCRTWDWTAKIYIKIELRKSTEILLLSIQLRTDLLICVGPGKAQSKGYEIRASRPHRRLGWVQFPPVRLESIMICRVPE